MHILLTNDDGIHAEGLWSLFQQLDGKFKITVIAPDRERSAVSHGITLLNPLRANFIHICDGFSGYAVNGTPADCVKLGIQQIMDSPPDLVISGINAGSNVGASINYSGTVAAAREAVLNGIPAMAVSVNGFEELHFDSAAQITLQCIQRIAHNELPFGTLLNVNVPNQPLEQIKGIRMARQGVAKLTETYEHRIDPRNNDYWWLGGYHQAFDNDPDIDYTALNHNYVAITPIQCDMTDYRLLEDLKQWDLNLDNERHH